MKEGEITFESNYEILGEIGKGGVGTVYKAYQKGLKSMLC